MRAPDCDQVEFIRTTSETCLVELEEAETRHLLECTLNDWDELRPVIPLLLSFCGLDFQCKVFRSQFGTEFEILNGIEVSNGMLSLNGGVKSNYPPMSAGEPYEETKLNLGALAEAQPQTGAARKSKRPSLLLHRSGYGFRFSHPDLKDEDPDIRCKIGASSFRFVLSRSCSESLRQSPAYKLLRGGSPIAIHPAISGVLTYIHQITTMLLVDRRVFVLARFDESSTKTKTQSFTILELHSGLNSTFQLRGKNGGTIQSAQFVLSIAQDNPQVLHIDCFPLVSDPALPSFFVLRTQYKPDDFNCGDRPFKMKQLFATNISRVQLAIPLS